MQTLQRVQLTPSEQQFVSAFKRICVRCHDPLLGLATKTIAEELNVTEGDAESTAETLAMYEIIQRFIDDGSELWGLTASGKAYQGDV